MKVKNKKSNLADMFASRRNKTVKKQSPFEIHINRAKQSVLGRKSKNDHGLPGVSRSKAITKRKQTLLQEFKVKDKDNMFYDKRIGEKNKFMSEEEKTMRRFVAERINRHKKTSVFNLNDEEILTHRGQSLMEIEKYDDPRSDDEDSDGEAGRLNSNFVEEAHFGGGLLEKKEEKMSHKDLIETLILESKKRKAEKKKMKEEAIDMTEKLDAQWKDLLPLITASQKTEEDKDKEKAGPVDDYDKLVRQMKYDRKAVAGEKLKSQEDMDKEEKERLEKLEKERLKRMEDEEATEKKKKHKSADDLDFDYLVEKVEDDEEKEDENLKLGEEEEEEVEDEDNDESEEDGSDEEGKEDDEEADDENKVEENNTDDESEEEDDLADLKESSSDDEEDEEEEKDVKQSHSSFTMKPTAKEIIVEIKEESKVAEKNVEKFKNLKKTYKIVQSLEELEQLLANYDHEQKSEIISRMIKGNEKSAGYKEQFGQLFEYLLQYLVQIPVETEEDLNKLIKNANVFSLHLYNLAHVNPEDTCKHFQNMLKNKHDIFEADVKKYPGLDTIILFKIAALIFPSSDFRHPVMTPCHVFMTQVLSKCQVKTRSDLAKGIFVCTLILENTLLSKRFAPSVINFIRGILYSSLQKDNTFKKPRAILPFKSFGPQRNFLILENSFKDETANFESLKMRASDLIQNEITDEFKVRLMATTVSLLNEFVVLLENLEAAYALFKPIQQILEFDVLNNYPNEVNKLGEEIQKTLKNIMNRELEYLALPKKKPKALKLYEPRIEPVYEGKRNRPESKEVAERQKMLHKLKMEAKNAKREIRRDNAFLAKVKISQQIKSDEERKRKVKELFADAAIQQSELKKLKK